MLSFVCVGDQTPVFQKLVSLSLSMMPPSSSSSWTQLALPSQSRSRIQPRVISTLGQKPILVSHRSPNSNESNFSFKGDRSELSALCFLEKWLTVVSWSARKNRIFFPFTFNLNKWIQRDTCLTTNKIDIWDGVGDPPWNSQGGLTLTETFSWNSKNGSNILKKLDLARNKHFDRPLKEIKTF